MTEEPQSEPRTPRFQPMEWGVLINDRGGRPCQIETTVWYGDTERVIEYYVQPGDKKSRYQLYGDMGWVADRVLKARDEAHAEQISKVLRECYEAWDMRVGQATCDRDNAVSRMIETFRSKESQL